MKRVRVDFLEDTVERVVERERVDHAEIARLQGGIRDAIEDVQAAEHETNMQLEKELARLEVQEERLVDAIADGSRRD